MSPHQGLSDNHFSGILYGSIPIFATLLDDSRSPSMEQIFVRLVISALLFHVYFALAENLCD
jgi:drug/metabolite transporter (DMT)-like permease